MTLIFEIPLALIAVFLTALGVKTLGAIKHLDVGKSFWIPILSSGISSSRDHLPQFSAT